MGRSPSKHEAAEVFGARMRSRRQALEWSQEKLAEQAGLHWTYVGSVERGERNLSLLNIVRLAHALGVDPGELVAGLSPEMPGAQAPDAPA